VFRGYKASKTWFFLYRFKVAQKYEQIDQKAHELGGTLNAPYMTLSFMALLVIPDIKLSDKGLFDGTTFSFTELFEVVN